MVPSGLQQQEQAQAGGRVRGVRAEQHPARQLPRAGAAEDGAGRGGVRQPTAAAREPV